MKIKNMLLSVSCLRLGIAALAVVFCGTAFAGPTEKAPVRATHRGHKTMSCYVMLSNSSFPQPCERLVGVAATATPMDIVGEIPIVRVVRK